jgi:hypothetical protein
MFRKLFWFQRKKKIDLVNERVSYIVNQIVPFIEELEQAVEDFDGEDGLLRARQRVFEEAFGSSLGEDEEQDDVGC